MESDATAEAAARTNTTVLSKGLMLFTEVLTTGVVAFPCLHAEPLFHRELYFREPRPAVTSESAAGHSPPPTGVFAARRKKVPIDAIFCTRAFTASSAKENSDRPGTFLRLKSIERMLRRAARRG